MRPVKFPGNANGTEMNSSQQFSIFESTFENTEQQELKAEDDEAWNGVTALLITIVSCGVVLGAIGVLLATFLT